MMLFLFGKQSYDSYFFFSGFGSYLMLENSSIPINILNKKHN